MQGESLHPAYEGWWPNPDGSFTMFFGYMNPNWEEEFDVPIGPENTIEPGGPDQGQPTHVFHTGEAMTVRLSVRAGRPTTDFVFGIAIFNPEGVCVYGTNTDIEEHRADRLEGVAERRR